MPEEIERSWRDYFVDQHLAVDEEIRVLLRQYGRTPRSAAAGQLRTRFATLSAHETVTRTTRRARCCAPACRR